LTGAAVFSVMSSQADLVRIAVTDLRTQGLPQAINNVAISGNQAIDIVTPGLAMVATLRTAQRGRAYRGRVFWSGFDETRINASRWLQGSADALVTTLELLRTTAALAGWTMVVVSRQLDGQLRAAGVGTPVTGVEVRNLFPGTQRRRIARP